MSEDIEDTPAHTSDAFNRMYEKWQLIHDLRGGTKMMRKAGNKWLPQEPAEKNDAYNARLNRSFLYNAFSNTVDKIVSKPFSKKLSLNGNLSDKLSEIEENADKSGTDLTRFSKAVFEDAVEHGKSHILVEYPRVENSEGMTLQDERRMNLRPYFVHIPATQLFAWKFRKGEGEEKKLSEIRYYEYVTEEVGKFKDKTEVKIRVLREQEWEVYRQNDKKEWSLEDSGTHSFDGIPLVTFYTNWVAPMEAEPPLDDLAWQNLEHWQSSSDQRNILRFSRFALLFASGLSEEDTEGGITVGPARIVHSTSVEADLKYVEHKGTAIEAGRKDLEEIEKRMEVLGLQPMVSRTSKSTATARAIDESRSHTDIQAWTIAMKEAIETAYLMASQWEDETLPEDFSVEFPIDFGLEDSDQQDMSTLLKMRQIGDIGQRTMIREAVRHGVMSEDTDIEEEEAESELG